MELCILLLLLLLSGVLILLARGHTKTHSCLPPGPHPLPFLGNILQMDRRSLLRSFLKLRDKYGDVFTVYLGSRPVVMLCGSEAIREALVDQAEVFSGRGKMAILDQVFKGYGVSFVNGECWKALRKFTLAAMKDFGMRKQSMEARIQEEAQCLVEELRKSQASCLPQMFELFSDILKYFPGTHRQINRNMREVKDFIGRSVEEHRQTLDPSSPRDFIDNYLLRMDKEKSNPVSVFNHQNLINTVLALLFGGMETTSTTLYYGFLFFLKYPHITGKVHNEIDQVIGSHCPPALDDRAKMPYTEAVINEIQRCGDILPIGVPHMVMKDTQFRGYIIPKGTDIYPLLSTALFDPRYFDTPDTFNPDRFLDATGALKNNRAFMPFSIGKRICLGEGLARAELFLFLTTILQNFSVASSMAPEDIDLTPQECGVGKVPPTYQIRFLSR
ncbi:cytochrome P450 2B4 isoform X2 [Pteronotus mesoamericanus]|uniref:cytochrome P450 2B4 isoform X2 n=1 Tax=Pteronotus mesoamericanus TaxID=1884717 RepID=UPI0023EAA272|nr:cytochrome P450 2B4 isoform X2 [Pteronotus parnellii mesoamericanus]